MGEELGKLKLLMAALMVWLVSGFFVYEELIYLVLGKDATATVTNVQPMTRRSRSGDHHYLKVDFSFTEANGTQRIGEDNMSTDWVPPSSNTLTVRYTPGISGRARIAGNVKWFGIALFVAAMCATFFFVLRLALASRPAPPPRRKKKRRRYHDD
jgi:hypothetical protein